VAYEITPYLVLASGAAIASGLGALLRGFGGYRSAARISDTSGSRVSSLAAGEVRLSGVVEAAEVTLISPLQSASCVYYRASVRQSERNNARDVFEEERAVGFRLRDETGTIRVFPRGARWDVPPKLDASTSMFGEEPAGLMYRFGPAIAPGPEDREAQVAALLAVHQPETSGGIGGDKLGMTLTSGAAHRRYVERRIEPGEIVTIIGQALPFDQLDDPTFASLGGSTFDPVAALDDPEIAADLAEARASGVLAADTASAWGNAAIPGFGIGRPTSVPVLDPRAARPTVASAADAARNRELFEIAPEELVLASTGEMPLFIAFGTPVQAAGREQGQFLLGLLGAVLAIAGAIGLALILNNGFTITVNGVPIS
jgi:hypothetical protein